MRQPLTQHLDGTSGAAAQLPLHAHLPPEQLTTEQLHERLAWELAPDTDHFAGLGPMPFVWQRQPPRELQKLLQAVPPAEQEHQTQQVLEAQQKRMQEARQEQTQLGTHPLALRGRHEDAPAQQQQQPQERMDSAQHGQQPVARKRGRPRLPEPENLGSIAVADPELLSVILKRRRNRENQAASRRRKKEAAQEISKRVPVAQWPAPLPANPEVAATNQLQQHLAAHLSALPGNLHHLSSNPGTTNIGSATTAAAPASARIGPSFPEAICGRRLQAGGSPAADTGAAGELAGPIGAPAMQQIPQALVDLPVDVHALGPVLAAMQRGQPHEPVGNQRYPLDSHHQHQQQQDPEEQRQQQCLAGTSLGPGIVNSSSSSSSTRSGVSLFKKLNLGGRCRSTRTHEMQRRCASSSSLCKGF
ncbi:hypothetical protein N2152v2_010015 [Parachlorella kessleri]